VVQHPGAQKYRRLRLSKPKFQEVIWSVPAAREVLKTAGWRTDLRDGYIVLPPDVGADGLLARVRAALRPIPPLPSPPP
jgi:PUB domain.